MVGDVSNVGHVCLGVHWFRLPGLYPRLCTTRPLSRLYLNVRRQLLSALRIISSLRTHLIHCAIRRRRMHPDGTADGSFNVCMSDEPTDSDKSVSLSVVVCAKHSQNYGQGDSAWSYYASAAQWRF